MVNSLPISKAGVDCSDSSEGVGVIVRDRVAVGSATWVGVDDGISVGRVVGVLVAVGVLGEISEVIVADDATSVWASGVCLAGLTDTWVNPGPQAAEKPRRVMSINMLKERNDFIMKFSKGHR